MESGYTHNRLSLLTADAVVGTRWPFGNDFLSGDFCFGALLLDMDGLA